MIELNKRQSAELFLATLGVLCADEDTPEAAFAEAIAHAERATILSLAECIAAELYGKPASLVEPRALRDVHGGREVNIALRMCGVVARERGAQVIWTTAAPDHKTGDLPVVVLSGDLLVSWYDI